jgi:hypothetical protein
MFACFDGYNVQETRRLAGEEVRQELEEKWQKAEAERQKAEAEQERLMQNLLKMGITPEQLLQAQQIP